jgi:hypothetical protein
MDMVIQVTGDASNAELRAAVLALFRDLSEGGQ